MKIFYYIRRFWEIPIIEKEFLIKGSLLFLIGKILIRFLPLKYYLSLFIDTTNSKPINKDNFCLIKIVDITIKRLLIIIPYNMSCLERVMLSSYLSKKLGIKYQVKFFLKKKNKKLFAHSRISFNYDICDKVTNEIENICLC